MKALIQSIKVLVYFELSTDFLQPVQILHIHSVLEVVPQKVLRIFVALNLPLQRVDLLLGFNLLHD